MSVGADFFKSEFLFQAFDTEVVWNWELTDDTRAMFYDVVPSPVPAMEFARVEVTRIVQRGSATPDHRAAEIHVKLRRSGRSAAGARFGVAQFPCDSRSRAIGMQIRALYDQRGRILAAVHLETTDAASGGSPTPQPEPRRGQRVGVFTVPLEFAHLSFAEACTQLMVKGKGKRATLMPRPS